jgi:hypothetical protein
MTIYTIIYINLFELITYLRFPLSGYISPVKHLKQDVLPAPVIPNKAKHSPYSNPNEMLLTATISLNYFYILSTLTGISS